MRDSDKTFMRRMSVLRMRLQTERNKPKPNQGLIDSMMAEYKRLETAAHVKLVFGDRGLIGSVDLDQGDKETQDSFIRRS